VIVVLVALAGALGAVTRFAVDSWFRSRFPRSGIPWAIAAINVSGSLVLGLLAGLVVLQNGSTDLQAVIGTGFCGGYTTFSTASVDTVRLVRSGKHAKAIGYAVGTLVLSVAACAAGFGLAGLA